METRFWCGYQIVQRFIQNCAVQSIPNLNKEHVLILPPLLCTLREKTGLYTSATDIYIYIIWRPSTDQIVRWPYTLNLWRTKHTNLSKEHVPQTACTALGLQSSQKWDTHHLSQHLVWTWRTFQTSHISKINNPRSKECTPINIVSHNIIMISDQCLKVHSAITRFSIPQRLGFACQYLGRTAYHVLVYTWT